MDDDMEAQFGFFNKEGGDLNYLFLNSNNVNKKLHAQSIFLYVEIRHAQKLIKFTTIKKKNN